MTKEKIIKGLTCHTGLNTEKSENCESCNKCPYNNLDDCTTTLTLEALSFIAQQNEKPDFIKCDDFIIDLNSIKTIQLVTEGNLILIDTHYRQYPYLIKADTRIQALTIFDQIFNQIISRSTK